MERHQLLLPSSSSLSTTTSPPIFPFAHSLSGDSPLQLNLYGSSNFCGGFLGLTSEEGIMLKAKDNSGQPSSHVDVLATEEESREKTAGKKKVKRQKFAFQTRSQVDILDDGYRWRKYGQKAVKKNKFPRSYYKCTYQGCNVKKQVQRLTGDEGVVVTTYEGIHTHPIDKPTENFEHILSQMHIYHPF